MELKGSKTENCLKEAFAGESQANRRYLYFANKADIEGQNDVAALFRSTAEGETGHAHGHLEFLEAVGDPATGLPRHGDFTGRRIVDSQLTQRAVYGEATLGADRDTSFVLGARRFTYDKRTEGEALIVNVISNTTEANFRSTTEESGWSL